MTKYVLNSGGLRDNPDLARRFFGEVLYGLGDNPRLLICLFAQPREDWESKFEEDKIGMGDMVSLKTKPILELAFPDSFAEQIKESDAVYIHGGDDHLIEYWLRQFDIPKIWEGKVIATNSASSHALSKYFWTCDWRKCMEGLGVLPVKFLAHYKSSYGNDDPRGPINWDEAYEKLKHFGDNFLPIHALLEGEYVVIEQ